MRRASPNLSMRNGAKSEHRDLQPDALGVATRLAAVRLREAGVDLKPLLRSAGPSASQINNKDMRIGVASQIRFLELAAKAVNDPLLGFRLTRGRGPPACRAALLHCRFLADARRRAGSRRALQFDRQCRRRSEKS